MIPEERYDEMFEKWAEATGERRVYAEKTRVWNRLLDYQKYVPVLNGKKVLEIGCNAGAHAYLICEQAESYVGLDPSKEYAEHFRITQSYISNINVVHMMGDLHDLAKHNPDIDAFCANYCLYHIPDDQLDVLRDKLLVKCDTVLIQNRNQKRPTAHNSYKFWKTKRIVRWLEKQGFNQIDVHDSPETRNHKGQQVPKWQTVVARKV